MLDKIKILALGGLDEDGKNCLVIEINDDIFVVSCGIKYPDKTMSGVDYIIPRFDYLIANKSRIKAYFLLHGHDDESGALAYIYNEAPAPIYASEVTLTMFKMFCRHVKVDCSNFNFHPVKATSNLVVSNRRISLFHTAHNIADSSGICFHTNAGNIVITGDYVVENNADPNYLHDMNAIAKLAEEQTLVLLSESVYFNKLGYTAPNYKLTPIIQEVFKGAAGRIYTALFSTNFYNIDEIIRLAIQTKRKIICYDEETSSIIKAMQSAGQLLIPRENYASNDDLLRYRDQDVLILICGFGAALYNKIALLSTGTNEDKRFRINESDTFILAAPSNDNTEIEAVDAIDEIYRSGCHVLNVNRKQLLNMHASEEDLKMMISILKPKYYIPVKGFYKDLLHNAMVSLSMGINLNHQNVFVLENGMSVLFEEGKGKIIRDNYEHGDIFIDGIGVGDVAPHVIEDRRKLAEGAVILAATISRKRRMIVAGPDVQMRGFIFARDTEALTKELEKTFVQTINEFLDKAYLNEEEMKQNAYERCLRLIRRFTGREPMLFPLIVEVE